jgi:hypothetical protein
MLSGTDHALMSETLNLLRESAIEETNSTLARSLHDRWENFISEVRRVHPGLQNTRVTYAFITAEMAELAPGYQATEWLTNAATDLWRDLTRRQLIDPHEIVGDETPIACTLNFFENVINIIRQTEQSFIDPVSLKVPIPNYSGSRSEY